MTPVKVKWVKLAVKLECERCRFEQRAYFLAPFEKFKSLIVAYSRLFMRIARTTVFKLVDKTY